MNPPNPPCIRACIDWKEMLVTDRAKGPKEALLKDVLHFQMIPAEGCFNHDRGLELPGSWIVISKALGRGG